MTTASNEIKSLIGYTENTWLNSAEERRALNALRTDTSFSRTINLLDKTGYLDNLFDRLSPSNLREFIQVLGGKQPNAVTDHILTREVKSHEGAYMMSAGVPLHGLWQRYYEISRSLQANMISNGLSVKAPAFNAKAHKSGVGKTSSSPFTGSGASRVNPSTLSVGVGDSYKLWRGKDDYPNTYRKYSNPLGGLLSYLGTLSAKQRRAQATLLIKQPISTVLPESYIGWIPSRKQVMLAAGKKHKLEPELIAAFVLAEQRDQSKLEDAKDYDAATSVMEGNTSIGLGQIVVSTARRNDLFADLLAPAIRKGLAHKQIANLLASDEFNIFGVARYVRQVADNGSKKTAAGLPNTVAMYSSVNFPAYAKHSKDWPEDNIAVMGAEYTSKAWDDDLKGGGWADFVVEAYKDVKASGAF